ncbi:snf1a Snf1-related kinase SNF1a [Reticulomyxa filosa]|uniref:Snf1a Snf1-related kinase SNF1a n=1 Tax=Reticulomyxa filosa TaxID=46433 RepID=X6NRB3_RETFI|nr:snf1a Snf1-related kinase SNF1a [Reticulomyxa filosa]|eukprot:ETO28453.1 snf1a Snf1-related kinase SNF1a [Reticulomyxa filosa]
MFFEQNRYLQFITLDEALTFKKQESEKKKKFAMTQKEKKRINAAKQIGLYQLGRTLGVGSFSKVKLGVHGPTGKRVAIKILNKQQLKKLEMEAKINREIEILAQLNHPHVIRLYEMIETGSDICLVMEYVPKGELFDYIVANGRLNG